MTRERLAASVSSRRFFRARRRFQTTHRSAIFSVRELASVLSRLVNSSTRVPENPVRRNIQRVRNNPTTSELNLNYERDMQVEQLSALSAIRSRRVNVSGVVRRASAEEWLVQAEYLGEAC